MTWFTSFRNCGRTLGARQLMEIAPAGHWKWRPTRHQHYAASYYLHFKWVLTPCIKHWFQCF